MRSIITTAAVAALALIGPLAADAEAQLVQQNGLDSTHCLIRYSISAEYPDVTDPVPGGVQLEIGISDSLLGVDGGGASPLVSAPAFAADDFADSAAVPVPGPEELFERLGRVGSEGPGDPS